MKFLIRGAVAAGPVVEAKAPPRRLRLMTKVPDNTSPATFFIYFEKFVNKIFLNRWLIALAQNHVKRKELSEA